MAGCTWPAPKTGGATWQKPILVGRDAPQDHEQIVVDTTAGHFAGRIYISALYGDSGEGYRVGLCRSDDDGRTWRGPVEFANGAHAYGVNVTNLVLFHDGTVFAPFVSWTRSPKERTMDTTYADFALSADGGVTFSAPRRIRRLDVRPPDKPGDHRPPEKLPQYAVDPSATAHHDRLYMVFPQAEEGTTRLYLQYSNDRGMSWSRAKRIDPTAPVHARQFQQMVTVNKDGVVGITWFDTRASQDGSGFDEYFVASVDGGDNFLSPVRVSTVTTVPDSPGNLGVTAVTMTFDDTLYVHFLSAAGRSTGGDYMGLIAQADGTFRPLWADARSGTYQLYTAPIRVVAGTDTARASVAVATTVQRLRNDQFDVLFDPTSYDHATGILTVPLRIRNRTDAPIAGPITLHVDLNNKLGEIGPEDEKYYPTILGAKNGKMGPGAEFDLTPVIGGTGVIAPGATTGSFMLQLKPQSLTEPIGNLMIFVTAGIL